MKMKLKTWKHNKALEPVQEQTEIVAEVQMVEIGVESQGPSVPQSLHSLTGLTFLVKAMA